MKSPNVILCDIGNVLIGWNQARLMDTIFRKTSAPNTPEIRLLFKVWNDLCDRGNMRELSQKQIDEYPHYASLIRAYCEYWPVSLDPVIEDTVAILKQTKQIGYKIYAASNFATDNFETARPHMTFLDLFDGIQISGDVKICKPDAAFYEQMMKGFSFSAEDAIFIDDRIDNIEAARKLGIHSILFTDPARLKLTIKNDGLFSLS